MPNHWETSARPLFVKTVFVNGNRHAILSEEDPLLRCGKKISRPNSSLSSASDLSINFSDSQDSGSEGKSSKQKSVVQAKDLSSELQGCLVKLKLASGSFEIQNKSNANKCLRNQGFKRNRSKDRGNSKYRRHKSNHEKVSRREQRELFFDEPKEYKLGGSSRRSSSSENGCYMYNLENYKEKKKYCFVKISSQPPEFIVNCCCEKNWNETHSYSPPNKNNLVISATIHNLVMTTDGSDDLCKTFDYIFPLQNTELHWNKYLAKSYYNSLSDRVFQWLDLARKRKTQSEKLQISADENDSVTTVTERIFSGKTFVGEKNEFLHKDSRILMNKKTEKITQNETPDDDIEGEVVEEPHVETLLSTDKSKDCLTNVNSPKEVFERPRSFSEQKANNFTPNTVNGPNSPNTKMSLLKIQDLLLHLDKREESRRKSKESRNSSPHQSKAKQTNNEENDFQTTAINSWEKRISEENIFQHKFDTNKQCQFNRNSDETADTIKNRIWTEEFVQKSINNPNITQTRSLLIQNSLSPQQPDKTCCSEEEKIVWASERSTGRPQLHIFMPSVLRKDQSDDSLSECESFLNS